MIPEKNNMETKEKNVEKNRKVKAKEPVTSAEEEEERIKAKKPALKRTESVKDVANAVTIPPHAYLPLRQRGLFFSTSKKKKKDRLTRNGPLSISLRCRSTALCVACLSAVFALLLVLRLICWAVLVAVGAAG